MIHHKLTINNSILLINMNLDLKMLKYCSLLVRGNALSVKGIVSQNVKHLLIHPYPPLF